MRLSRSAFGLAAAAAACSLADYDVAETFTASADPYVRMSNDADAGATPLAVTVVPGPALRHAVTVSLSGADGVVCPPIQIDPADASTWTGTLMLTAAADAGVQPMLWDASVHFQSPGFAADVPVMIREGSAIAIVTPGSCGVGGPPIVASACKVTVPPDAKNGLVVWAIGGGGGGGAGTNINAQKCATQSRGGDGGAAGYVVAQISASPGAQLLAIAGTGGHEGLPVNGGDNYAAGGGGGGLSGVFDGVDAAPLVIAGGGGGGSGGTCSSNTPVDGKNGGHGSGGAGTSGSGSSGGGGGSETAPGTNGTVCDTITLRSADYLVGGGCDPSDASFVCASGGAPGGGGGYGVSQSLSGGGGGGAGLFGGGAGGSPCNASPAGGGGGSGYVSAGVLVIDGGVPFAVGTIDAGPGAGGAGGTKNPTPGFDGYVFIYLR